MSFSKKQQNRFADVPKVVEEENYEDEGYHSMRRARFKMIQDKNEFNKKCKQRNRSTDLIQERLGYPQIGHDFGDVSENEEEEISDSSFEKE